MKFMPGQRVKVSRIKSLAIGEDTYGNKYPKVGWTGTLLEAYDNTEWIIKWDKECDTTGDLVRTWMLSEPLPKIITPYRIVRFLTGERTK